jgi:predicted homoserine dehydrogenase-like protein
MERRQFIQRVASTALVSATALSGARILGANDRVNVGLIGWGGRGRGDANLLRQVSGVKVVAVCDVYEPHAEAAKAWAGSRCRSYGD